MAKYASLVSSAALAGYRCSLFPFIISQPQSVAPSPSHAQLDLIKVVTRKFCESLTKLGVRHIFGYPGGAILPVYDALGKSKLIIFGSARTGRYAHGRWLCARQRRSGRSHGHERPGRSQHGYRHCHRDVDSSPVVSPAR